MDMAIKQTDLTDAKKTKSGATEGSTGHVVDMLTQTFLKNREKQRERIGLRDAIAKVLNKKSPEGEEGSGRVR